MDQLYLGVVTELYSWEAMNWSVGSRMKAQLIADALCLVHNNLAIWQFEFKGGLIMHIGKGSQYVAHQYQYLLLTHKIKR
jgi:hypothetical protein